MHVVPVKKPVPWKGHKLYDTLEPREDRCKSRPVPYDRLRWSRISKVSDLMNGDMLCSKQFTICSQRAWSAMVKSRKQDSEKYRKVSETPWFRDQYLHQS